LPSRKGLTSASRLLPRSVACVMLACVMLACVMLACVALARLGAAHAAQDELGPALELVDPNVLRVCADPRNLPYSDAAGDGFENKLAELVARKLGKTLDYTFYPGATGFVRNTLNAHRCDIVMGMPQGDELVQVTNPYYRTSYVVVVRTGSDLADVATLDDPRLKGKRLGIIAGTPPATNLAVNGLLATVKSYPLVVDTRYDAPSREMIEDLEAEQIDAAILWGPIGGYWAKKAKASLVVTPLVKESSGPRLVYRIGMGVRHSDQEWKRLLNKLIGENEGEIRSILLDYGVPLLDENNVAVSH
jgi:quinoprotein dehydrogenase-associated probable ABC transporter substrate-binding protein